MQISATIITLNEANNLRRACQSLQGVADEIVIVDSGSQDGTLEVAQEFSTCVSCHPFESYSKQKNLAAGKATHRWVLSIDADECLSNELRQSILTLKSSDLPAEVAGFRFARLPNYLGGWIRHSGWYPDYKTRLYDRTRGRWRGDYVHESLEVNGRIDLIAGNLLHYTVNSLSDHVSRLNRYTTLAANNSLADGKKASPWKCIFAPPWTFIKSYFLRGGILDGWRGLCIASFAAGYVFLKEAKLWEMTRPDRESSGPLP